MGGWAQKDKPHGSCAGAAPIFLFDDPLPRPFLFNFLSQRMRVLRGLPKGYDLIRKAKGRVWFRDRVLEKAKEFLFPVLEKRKVQPESGGPIPPPFIGDGESV